MWNMKKTTIVNICRFNQIGILTDILHYEWDEEFQRREEWAARVKADGPT